MSQPLHFPSHLNSNSSQNPANHERKNTKSDKVSQNDLISQFSLLSTKTSDKSFSAKKDKKSPLINGIAKKKLSLPTSDDEKSTKEETISDLLNLFDDERRNFSHQSLLRLLQTVSETTLFEISKNNLQRRQTDLAKTTLSFIDLFNAQDLATIASAFACCDILDKQLFEAISQRILSIIKLYQETQVYSSCEDLTPYCPVSPHSFEISAIAKAFAHLDFKDEAFSIFLSSCFLDENPSLIYHFNNQQLIDITCFLSTVEIKNSNVWNALALKFLSSGGFVPGRFENQDITRLAHAFASIGFRHETIFESIADRSLKRFRKFNASQISSLIHSFALVRIKNDRLLTALSLRILSNESKTQATISSLLPPNPSKASFLPNHEFISSFTFEEIITLSQALATLEVKNDFLFKTLAHQILSHKNSQEEISYSRLPPKKRIEAAIPFALIELDDNLFFETLVPSDLEAFNVDSLTTGELIELSWFFTKRGIKKDQLLSKINESINSDNTSNLSSLTSKNLAQILFIFAKFKIKNNPLFQKIADHILKGKSSQGTPIFSTFNFQDIATIIWAFARCEILHKDLLDALISQILDNQRLSLFVNSQALADITWACAIFRIQNRDLFSHLASHILNNYLGIENSFTARNSIDIAWAFASLGMTHARLFDAIAFHISDGVDKERLPIYRSLNPQDIAVIASAFAKARVKNDNLLQKLLMQMASKDSQNVRLIKHFSFQELVDTTFSFTFLKGNTTPLLQYLYLWIQNNPDELTSELSSQPQIFTKIVRVFAEFSIQHPSEPVPSEISHLFSPILDDTDRSTIESLIESLSAESISQLAQDMLQLNFENIVFYQILSEKFLKISNAKTSQKLTSLEFKSHVKMALALIKNKNIPNNTQLAIEISQKISNCPVLTFSSFTYVDFLNFIDLFSFPGNENLSLVSDACYKIVHTLDNRDCPIFSSFSASDLFKLTSYLTRIKLKEENLIFHIVSTVIENLNKTNEDDALFFSFEQALQIAESFSHVVEKAETHSFSSLASEALKRFVIPSFFSTEEESVSDSETTISTEDLSELAMEPVWKSELAMEHAWKSELAMEELLKSKLQMEHLLKLTAFFSTLKLRDVEFFSYVQLYILTNTEENTRPCLASFDTQTQNIMRQAFDRHQIDISSLIKVKKSFEAK